MFAFLKYSELEEKYSKLEEKYSKLEEKYSKLEEKQRYPEEIYCNLIWPLSKQWSISMRGEMLKEYLQKKCLVLRKNIDQKSNEVLDYVIDSIVFSNFFQYLRLEQNTLSFPFGHLEHKKMYEAELSDIIKRYNLDGVSGYSPEIFYFHHGLRFSSETIKKYIKSKDILDCGAFIGDSALIFSNYTDNMIYCYEFSDKNIEKFNRVIELNNVNKERIKLIKAGLLDKSEILSIGMPDFLDSGSSLKENRDGGHTVNITTIDEETKKHHWNLGFIKVDVEGNGMKVIEGGIETIRKNRPVLSLGIYHNRYEFFEVKPFLEKYLDEYIYEFRLYHFDIGEFNELNLFCYPKELG